MQYEAPEVLEIGQAQEIILGANKGSSWFDEDRPMADLAFAIDEVDS